MTRASPAVKRLGRLSWAHTLRPGSPATLTSKATWGHIWVHGPAAAVGTVLMLVAHVTNTGQADVSGYCCCLGPCQCSRAMHCGPHPSPVPALHGQGTSTAVKQTLFWGWGGEGVQIMNEPALLLAGAVLESWPGRCEHGRAGGLINPGTSQAPGSRVLRWPVLTLPYPRTAGG